MATPNKEKRILKREPKLNVELNEEQKEFAALFYEKDVNFVMGDFGSGKSLVAVYLALSTFRKKMFNKIWITRPMLKNNLAALPGAQPYDAKILTESGWTTMGEIKKGDFVYAFDGTLVEVLGTYEHGERDVFEIKTIQGKTTKACDKHLWEVQESNYKRKYNNSKLVDTTYIKENLINSYGGFRFSLPINSAIPFKEKELPLHPYVIGALLGDGSYSNKKGVVVLCNTDQELIQRVSELIEPLGCTLTNPTSLGDISYYMKSTVSNNKPAKTVKVTNTITNQVSLFDRIGEAAKELKINQTTINSRCVEGRVVEGLKYEFIDDREISTNPIKNILISLGMHGLKAYEKSIPSIYKLASYEQRLELIRGILDTDGNIKSNGEVNFTTTSKQLAEDVREIIQSLGGKASISVRDRIGKQTIIMDRSKERTVVSRRVSYQLVISFKEFPELFFVSRKKERLNLTCRIHKDFIKEVNFLGREKVKCIKINHPRELYITDDYIVTHNTADEKMRPYIYPIVQNLQVCQGKEITEKMMKEGDIEIVPIEVAKGLTFSESIVLVDEFVDMDYQDFRTILTRLGKDSKIVFAGSKQQIDKSIGKNSCYYKIEQLKESGLVNWVELTEQHRNPILVDIIKYIEEND